MPLFFIVAEKRPRRSAASEEERNVEAHRDAFCVDVVERDFVYDVKRAIAKVHKSYQFPANYLKLYLATKDNAWLRDDDDTAERLRNGVVTDDMEAMIATKPLMAMLTIRTSLGDDKLRALSKKQIHILVTLSSPAVMLGSADPTKRFAQAPEVTALVDKIRRVQCMEDMPFVVLENSSSIGMTQMAFNLMAHGELDARYVVADPASDSHLQQRVYCAFGVRSTVLKTCATFDLPCVGRGAASDIPSNKQLYAFGFIWAMLSGPRTFTGVKSKEDHIIADPWDEDVVLPADYLKINSIDDIVKKEHSASTWRYYVQFPPINEDEVQPIPLSQALSTVQQTIRELDDKANLLAYDDAVQLEALVVSAVVLASHSGGFAGMRFDAFFGALLYELGMRAAPNEPIVFPVASINDMIVPFLSPPNVEWPCFLPAELNLGNLAKMTNSDGAQILVFNESVSAECWKDRNAHPLSLRRVKIVLRNVLASTTTHLVVINSLKRTYFTRQPNMFDAFVAQEQLD